MANKLSSINWDGTYYKFSAPYQVITNNSTNYSVSTSISANTFYQFPTVSALTINLIEPTDTTVVNEYIFEFQSHATKGTSLSLPSTVKWVGNANITSGKTYQVSIINNIAVMGGA